MTPRAPSTQKPSTTSRCAPPEKHPKEWSNPEEEDPLKWVEEHIPESGDNPLPVLDSDEELETTKFEISKMQ